MISENNYYIEKKNILEHLLSDGVKNLKPLIEVLLNEAMKIRQLEFYFAKKQTAKLLDMHLTEV